MKAGKKYWRMKSLTGVILACTFLAACGGEMRETESKNAAQESRTASIGTIEQTAQYANDLMTGHDELKILEEVEKTEDRETVYELAGDFATSYFQEEYTGDVQIMGIKGLSGVGADNSAGCTVEVEFLPAQEDSLSYLFMTFEKDGTEWTISSYGLEK